MASYPGRRGRARRPLHLVQAETATRMSDDLLRANLDQVEADATGLPVGDARPQHYGLPAARANAAAHLAILRKEARRRGWR